ncbi:MAG: hypothetical protein WBH51_18080 [Mycolicibacter algericus]|nr:hypothetical protein [Mycolicibacter sinensis]
MDDTAIMPNVYCGRCRFSGRTATPSWEDIMLTVEYDGDQHRTSWPQFVKDAERIEYIQQVGWTHVKVLAEHRDHDVIRRVQRAWDALILR